MNGFQRDQCLAGAAFRNHHGCPRMLPTFGHSHDGDGLCRERRSQQPCNPSGSWMIELVQRWILLQNAVAQESPVSTHVVVDGAELWHRNPQTPNDGT